MSRPVRRVAVIGAGLAGALCARRLADAGLEVRVFDKSRGAGGRMATRRAPWTHHNGAAQEARFDHGAPGFSASSPEFARFVAQAADAGLLSRWTPRLAPGPHAPLDAPTMWVPVPDMPAWCRALLAGLPLHTGCTVDALRRSPAGWSLESAGAPVAEGWDAVIVAMPPRQAAVLLQPHQADWAGPAAACEMLPVWALMGVTDDPQLLPEWDLARPSTGPLSWVVRDDCKPGRQRVPGLAHWVVHATPAWSQAHLESPAEDVQEALQAALARCVGSSLTWHHAAVHRWRYATVPGGHALARSGPCGWHADTGLGVCGDAWGGSGVEGAWRSAEALAAAVIGTAP